MTPEQEGVLFENVGYIKAKVDTLSDQNDTIFTRLEKTELSVALIEKAHGNGGCQGLKQLKDRLVTQDIQKAGEKGEEKGEAKAEEKAEAKKLKLGERWKEFSAAQPVIAHIITAILALLGVIAPAFTARLREHKSAIDAFLGIFTGQ